MAKTRVHELAKELGVESKVVLEKLKEMGEFVKSASSTIETRCTLAGLSALVTNAIGSSAIIASRPWVMPLPSTATVVATQGTPCARLFSTLPLMPAPQRSGRWSPAAQRDRDATHVSAIGYQVRWPGGWQRTAHAVTPSLPCRGR